MQRKFKKAVTGLLTTYYAMFPTVVWAAANGQRIIDKMQQGAFWLGIALTIWGAYEWQIGGPGGMERIKRAVFGYIAILLVPLLFMELRNAFSGMTW